MRAFLGIGLLGSNFVKALLEKGEDVHIWNRTKAKATALEQDGAQVFDTPADAVKEADFIHLTLKDDSTVNEVLEKALPGMKPGAIIVDHTTTSVEGAIQRTADWVKQGFQYQHAPVFMGPKNAREGSGVMMVSGDQELISQLEPLLSGMTGKVLNFGPSAGKAAGIKLAGNLFLIAVTGGVADMLALAGATGLTMEDLFTLFEQWNPGAAVTGRLKKIEEADFTHPSWELDMARKDAGLMMNAASSGRAPLTVIPAVAAEMDRWIAEGYGKNDWTVFAQEPSGRI